MLDVFERGAKQVSFQDRGLLAAEFLLALAIAVSQAVANGVDSVHHLVVVLLVLRVRT